MRARMSRAADQTGWRVVTAARVFTLAIALGLAVTTGAAPALVAPFMMLCVLSAIMSLPVPTTALRTVMPMAEAVIVGLLVASIGEPATPLLAYLLVAPFAAGVQAGARGAALATASECLAGGVVLITESTTASLADLFERSAPWMLVGLGLGLLGSWVRTSTNTVLSEQQRYESAHRLLAQLETVARDLPHGLDTPSLAQRTLSYAMGSMEVGRAMLLLRDKTDAMYALAVHGSERFSEPLDESPLVAECWHTKEVTKGSLPGARATVHHRAVLPLRVGTRMVGVIVVDTPHELTTRELRAAQVRLDEHSLRLESATLFDHVRLLATAEERHRLAREIHDGIAQEVASLGYLVDDLAATTDTREGKEAARALRAELTRIVNELRLSIFDLRMEVNQRGGLGQAISDYARDIGGRAGMTVHVALAEASGPLPRDAQTELLRIAQEAITNVRKHARASNLWVTLNTNGAVVLLRIEDDGVGRAHVRQDHFGLRMMRERADRIGAELAVTDRSRGGTSVVVALQPQHITSGGPRADLSTAR